ncbi:MAG TPA: YciI family protein [Gemmatimonadales bacterium]|nr:YciI family protein [Gemmatimonadales bacterium]
MNPNESETTMRFLVMVKGNKEYEAGAMPKRQELAEMGKFNDELVKAGIMLAGEGLQPSSKGARISYSGTKRTVRDGPFTEAKELVAGFWIWQVKSRAEALEWAKRIPFTNGEEVEIRQIFEAADFGDEFTPELRQQEARQRTQIEQNKQRARQ